MSSRTKIILFFVLLVAPFLMASVTATVAFKRAERVEFCASCHTMTPWVENVTGADSDSLASEHYKHRWIQEDQCYTCHSNYGFLGPVQAKIKGVRHVIAYYIGDTSHIKLYDPFPNENCLQCHAEAKTFKEDPNHDPIEDILLGKDRCVECHENVHGVEQPGDGKKDDTEAKADTKDADGGKNVGKDSEKDEAAGAKEDSSGDADKGN